MRAMDWSCSLAVVANGAKPSPASQALTRSAAASIRPGVTATRRSLFSGRLPPNMGWVPTTGPA